MKTAAPSATNRFAEATRFRCCATDRCDLGSELAHQSPAVCADTPYRTILSLALSDTTSQAMYCTFRYETRAGDSDFDRRGVVGDGDQGPAPHAGVGCRDR